MCISIQAQIPLIHNYTTENAPDFEVCFRIFQDRDGLMYFGARDGLHTFDGYKWEAISTITNTARAIAQDKYGTVFVGTHKDIGYLEVQPTGHKTFISLSSQLTEEEKKLPTIWDITDTPNGILVRSQRFIYQFQKQGEQYKKVKSFPAFGDISLSFQVDNEFYTTESTEDKETPAKLFKYSAGKKTEMITHKKLASIHAMIKLNNEEILLVDREIGFMIYNKAKQTIKTLDEHPMQGLLKRALTYDYVLLKNGNFALGTNNEGILIFSKDLQLLHQINESVGLQSNIIHTLFEDQQGNLWTGAGQGVSKISLSLPFLLYDKYAGIRDKVYDMLEHQNTLYLATNSGVYYQEDGKFKLIEGTVSQCWNIFPYKEGIMVGGGNSGAFYIENKKLIHKLAVANSVMRLAVSKKDSSILYVATYGGLRIFKFQNKQFTDLGLIKATETDCRTVVERTDGHIWVGTTGKGFFEVTFQQGFDTPEGVAKAITKHHTKGLRELERNRVFENSKGIFFTSKTGLYQFNQSTETFELYNNFSLDYDIPKYNSPAIREDKAGNFWFLNAKMIWKGNQIDSLSLLPIPKGINGFYETPTQNWIFLATPDGVYRYDNSKTISNHPFKTNITSISFSENDSLLPLKSRQVIQIPYHQNSLMFKFACFSFFVEKENQFQYKLDNYDTHWSAWTKLPQKEYTNLREGTYTFRVRAKNNYGQYAQEVIYTFIVLPPWYRTWYAYIAYFVGSVLLIWLIVSANTHRLEAQKKRLEHIVKERTLELEQRNVELEQQKEEIITIAENLKEANLEISTQNKNTTASINYAKRIQNAILPFPERILQTLQEYFIFYKPRDIVSGDFYFFEDKGNKILFAVVDCTGHGVPGAFMSMIGNGLLNDIVNKDNILEPDLILNELHRGIRYALKQKETHNNDGMDIGIIVIDKKKQVLEFAGAKNALVYFRNNTIHQIKGDKLLIGGEQREIERIFSKKTISLAPDEGDNVLMLYLFSDGIHDQFGGNESKKYSSMRLRDFLAQIHQASMPEQKQRIEKEFMDWKGHASQTDDALLVGIRLSLPLG